MQMLVWVISPVSVFCLCFHVFKEGSECCLWCLVVFFHSVKVPHPVPLDCCRFHECLTLIITFCSFLPCQSKCTASVTRTVLCSIFWYIGSKIYLYWRQIVHIVTHNTSNLSLASSHLAILFSVFLLDFRSLVPYKHKEKLCHFLIMQYWPFLFFLFKKCSLVDCSVSYSNYDCTGGSVPFLILSLDAARCASSYSAPSICCPGHCLHHVRLI